MNRGFKKISFDQYCIDVDQSKENYDFYNMPKRSTKHSAGYDFKIIKDVTIKPGETIMIPTGIKAYMLEDEVLYIIIRSSVGYKHNILLANQTGVIDCDYFNNIKNEGHIFTPIKNAGDKDYILKKGDPYAQGIFSKYLKIDNEEEIINNRVGGFGSTSRKEENNE